MQINYVVIKHNTLGVFFVSIDNTCATIISTYVLYFIIDYYNGNFYNNDYNEFCNKKKIKKIVIPLITP